MTPRLAVLAAVLLLLAPPARAEVDELVRRAEVRIAHGNGEGAARLLRQAVAEDASCARALDLLCEVDQGGGTLVRFYYLINARPLDLEKAARLLRDLTQRLAEIGDEACREVERASMLPAEPELGDGPVQPWDRLPTTVPALLPHGPLRWEVGELPMDRLRRLARDAASRLERDDVVDDRLWRELALVHRRLGDVDAAEAALAHAQPADTAGRIGLAWYAVQASRDPHAWWTQHGDPLLAEAQIANLSEEHRAWVVSLCGAAAKTLAEARDMPAIARLIRGALPCLAAGSAHRVMEDSAAAIASCWHADEACRLLESESDPAIACLRGHLWLLMLQDDRALKTFEGVLAVDPDYLGALGGLWELYGRARRPRRQQEVGDRIVGVARRMGIPIDLEFQYERVRPFSSQEGIGRGNELARELFAEAATVQDLMNVLFYWNEREGPLPTDEILRVLRKTGLPEGSTSRKSIVGKLARALLAQGRGAEVLEWADRLEPAMAAGIGSDLAAVAARDLPVEAMSDLLRAAAGCPTPSLSRDVLLRRMLAVGPEGVPFWLQRIRQDLDADPTFAILPSAQYVVSHLYDPVLQRDRIRGLQRTAYERGCRAPGLLGGMARDGEDVLDELQGLHAAEAHLVRALRSGDAEQFRAFLEEEDTALPDQLAEARSELQRLGARIVVPAAPGRTEASRAYMGEGSMRDRAVALVGLLADPPEGGATYLAPGAARLQLQLPWTLTDQAMLTLPGELMGRSGRLHVPLDPETEPIRALWRRASSGAERGRLLAVVREVAARHPLDLRWVAAERVAGQPAAEAMERMRPFRRCNARILIDLMQVSRGSPAVRDSYSALESLLSDDSPLASCEAAGSILDLVKGDAEQVRKVLDREAARCRTLWEEARVSSLAGQYKHDELSGRLDRDLWQSGLIEDRKQAVWREAARRKGQAAGWFLEAASWSQWSGRERREFLFAAHNADEKERGSDLASRALQELWSRALLDEGERDNLRYDAERTSCDPGGLASSYFRACRVATDDKHPDEVRKAIRPLLEAGCVRRDWQGLAIRGMDGKEARREWRAALEAVPPGQASWCARRIALALIEAMWMAGETEDAVAVADAWAQRCGTVQVDASEYRVVHELGLRRSVLSRPPSSLRMPPSGLAACCLMGPGERFPLAVRAAVHERVEQACRESDEPCLRELLLFQQAQMIVDRDSGRDTFPLLWRARAAASTREAWEWADGFLAKACERDPSLGSMSEDFLLAEWRDVAADPFDVREFTVRLSAPSTEAREEAMLALRWRGPAAVPLLRELRGAADPEVQERAKALLEELAAPDRQ